MNRFTSLFILLLATLLATGCAGSNGTDAVATPAAENDAAEIYAAAIRQIRAVDHTFDRAPGWPLVYVLNFTDDSAIPEAPKAPSTKLPVELQEAITAELSDQSFELTWIGEFADAPIDPTDGSVAGGEGIIITLGNIHAQDDGSVQLPFFMTCGGLCGIGKTYVLNRVGDTWQVTGSVGPEIMS